MPQNRQTGLIVHGVDLVQQHHRPVLAATQFLQHRPHRLILLPRRRRRRIHDVQQQVRVNGLLKRGPERRHQVVRQPAQKPDGVAQQRIRPRAGRFQRCVLVSSVAN